MKIGWLTLVVLLCGVGHSLAQVAPLPVPNNDTQALFLSTVGERPFGQQTLYDIMPILAQYCIALTPPNAVGERTKIGDPVSGHWTRVGFGEGHWVWVVQADLYVPSCGTPVPLPPPPAPPPLPSVDLSPVLNRLDQVMVMLRDHEAAQADERAKAEAFRQRVGVEWRKITMFATKYILPAVGAWLVGQKVGRS